MTAKTQKHTDYSGTPLPKKLGLVSASEKAPVEVALLGAPEGFRESLGELPASVTFAKRLTPGTTLRFASFGL